MLGCFRLSKDSEGHAGRVSHMDRAQQSQSPLQGLEIFLVLVLMVGNQVKGKLPNYFNHFLILNVEDVSLMKVVIQWRYKRF